MNKNFFILKFLIKSDGLENLQLTLFNQANQANESLF